LFRMRDGEVFKVSLAAMESVKREVRDAKIIASGGSGGVQFCSYEPFKALDALSCTFRR
jgi:hypothetical protein